MGTRAELINWRVSRELKKSSMTFELNKSSDSLVTNTAELREIPGKRDKILMRAGGFYLFSVWDCNCFAVVSFRLALIL